MPTRRHHAREGPGPSMIKLAATTSPMTMLTRTAGIGPSSTPSISDHVTVIVTATAATTVTRVPRLEYMAQTLPDAYWRRISAAVRSQQRRSRVLRSVETENALEFNGL